MKSIQRSSYEAPEGPLIVARHFSGGYADNAMRVL